MAFMRVSGCLEWCTCRGIPVGWPNRCKEDTGSVKTRIPYFLVFYGFLPSRCLESEMGPQIPPASIVTKVWILGVYNNAAE